MRFVIKWFLLISIGFNLAACGKEGPLGNTPGPKKPAWRYDAPQFR
jgi:predicted small lipoprotein YifL